MSLEIHRLPSGPAETNAYLVIDTATGDAMLVDTPPDIAEKLVPVVESSCAAIRFIVITHGHWDHIHGAAAVLAKWPVSVIGHERVRARLEHPDAMPTMVGPMSPVSLDKTIDEGDMVELGDQRWKLMYVPGHDVAQILLYNERDGVILGGDVLFPDGHGRTDLPGSDQQVMNHTLKRLMWFPPETRVLPGHGVETTIGRESRWITEIR